MISFDLKKSTSDNTIKNKSITKLHYCIYLFLFIYSFVNSSFFLTGDFIFRCFNVGKIFICVHLCWF